MFPNQDHGRMMVNEEGSLIIESVQRQDSGEYICKGLSAAGSAYAKAKLEVRGRYSIQLLSWLHHSAYGHPSVQRPTGYTVQYNTCPYNTRIVNHLGQSEARAVARGGDGVVELMEGTSKIACLKMLAKRSQGKAIG